MGLFDRLFRKESGNVFGVPNSNASAGIPERLDSAAVDRWLRQSHDTREQRRQDEWVYRQGYEHPEYYIKTQVTEKPYFKKVIYDNFQLYDIREDVTMEEFGGAGDPFDFVLYKNDVCVAAILLVRRYGPTRNAFKSSRALAEAAGIPVVTFHMHMPNVEAYVVEHLKKKAQLPD